MNFTRLRRQRNPRMGDNGGASAWRGQPFALNQKRLIATVRLCKNQVREKYVAARCNSKVEPAAAASDDSDHVQHVSRFGNSVGISLTRSSLTVDFVDSYRSRRSHLGYVRYQRSWRISKFTSKYDPRFLPHEGTVAVMRSWSPVLPEAMNIRAVSRDGEQSDSFKLKQIRQWHNEIHVIRRMEDCTNHNMTKVTYGLSAFQIHRSSLIAV